MRIAIVNDLRMAVEALRRVVTSVPSYQIAWVAVDGVEAVENCAEDVPDLILMDLVMPRMDGAAATRTIMGQSPCAILVVTATIEGHSAKVFEAMGAGALDVVTTPTLGGRSGGSELLAKIATIAKLIGAPRVAPPEPLAPETVSHKSRMPLVAIAASTGGPKALARVLSQLRRPAGAAIAIVQHIDVEFAPTLANWLTQEANRPVQTAEAGERPRVGLAHLAATADHLVLTRTAHYDYEREPAEYPYRPSADVFFKTVAAHWPGPAVGVVLTGMGNDGAAGLLAMRRRGWHTITQDEETSVVYGMPRAAAECGASAEVRPLDDIAGAIDRAVAEAAVSPHRS